MQIARVIGDVVATRKEPALEGVTLLVIQPLAADGQDSGRPLVAVDAVGAGVGETVFFVRGKEASFPFYPKEVPADAGIVGIIDHWSTDMNADLKVRATNTQMAAQMGAQKNRAGEA